MHYNSKITLVSDKPIREAFKSNLSKEDIKSLNSDIRILINITVNKNVDVIAMWFSSQDAVNFRKIKPQKIEKLMRDIMKNLKVNTSKVLVDEDYEQSMFLSVKELKKNGDALLIF